MNGDVTCKGRANFHRVWTNTKWWGHLTTWNLIIGGLKGVRSDTTMGWFSMNNWYDFIWSFLHLHIKLNKFFFNTKLFGLLTDIVFWTLECNYEIYLAISLDLHHQYCTDDVLHDLAWRGVFYFDEIWFPTHNYSLIAWQIMCLRWVIQTVVCCSSPFDEK